MMDLLAAIALTIMMLSIATFFFYMAYFKYQQEKRKLKREIDYKIDTYLNTEITFDTIDKYKNSCIGVRISGIVNKISNGQCLIKAIDHHIIKKSSNTWHISLIENRYPNDTEYWVDIQKCEIVHSKKETDD